MVPVVLGLDLSLRAPAACVLGATWDPARAFGAAIDSRCWKAKLDDLEREHAGAEDWPERRRSYIARWVAGYAETCGATRVFVEDYAWSAQPAKLAELGGVVKHLLWAELGLRAVPVVAASARKTLLGKVPSKKTSGVDVKDHVNHQLARMGAKFATMDEGDAFVICNMGRAMLGLPHLGVGP